MAITRLAPSLASTNLGAGRNKLFIRGIADSSFSGPTQATTGQFLGDIRLTYNSPDPDLNLYDMKRFEILAGPQGTLYGTGSLGGIVRMVPHTPDVNRFGATAAMGIGSTRSGGLSGDGAAMINLPLVSGHVAARLVVYGNHSAGYIDAPLQHRRNINSMTRHGARISLRAEDVAGWTIDAGGLMQNIASGDGQYVLRGSPPFMRGGLVPQPFENEYGLGYISVSREVGGARLVSVSSFARQRQSSVFDAAGLAGVEQPTRYTEDNDTALAYHETRLSGADPRKPWTAGVMLTSNISRLSISLGPVSQRNGSGGRRERQVEVALFGQMTHPLTRTTAVTFGGRLSFAHASQGLINVPLEDPTDATRDILRAFGTVGLNWNPRKALTFFYHYQQGYRPGGLGIFYADGALRSSRYAADELNIHEIGLRWGKASELLSGQAAIFSGRWDNIQADLIGEVGLPNTANIGRGAIKGLEAELNWRPFPSLLITGSFFLNDSRLVSYWTTPSAVDGGRLPNVAHSGAGGSVSWERRIQSNAMLTLEGAARYVGRSYLGVGSLQQIGQGNYLVIDIGAHWKAPRFGVALTISNLAGTRSNTFSYGNPFDLGRREQITPLRPRSIRLGLDFSF
ncbi:MAG TPA: TonB-dependent receptor [Sphingobium sp.]|uniref:TonB-dependent receptor n=1 Tax=Sphingobium sp. TaxID=1912891 RepID=UPI002ED2648D